MDKAATEKILKEALTANPDADLKKLEGAIHIGIKHIERNPNPETPKLTQDIDAGEM